MRVEASSFDIPGMYVGRAAKGFMLCKTQFYLSHVQRPT